jgi:hypothetical protein
MYGSGLYISFKVDVGSKVIFMRFLIIPKNWKGLSIKKILKIIPMALAFIMLHAMIII